MSWTNSRAGAAPAFAGSLLLLTMMPMAHAALGGDVASILRDHQRLQATHRVTQLANYEIHEGQTSAGTHLREYVDRAGREFAVSWQSQRAVDITSLLGAYAGRYQAAAQAHRSGHHLLVINSADLTLSVAHLPRGWQGLAILTGAVPAGVAPADIR
jgi:hypothetical protein